MGDELRAAERRVQATVVVTSLPRERFDARRLVVSLSSVFPLAGVFAATLANLQRLTPLPW